MKFFAAFALLATATSAVRIEATVQTHDLVQAYDQIAMQSQQQLSANEAAQLHAKIDALEKEMFDLFGGLRKMVRDSPIGQAVHNNPVANAIMNNQAVQGALDAAGNQVNGALGQ